MIDIKTLHKEDDKFYAEDNGVEVAVTEMFPIEEWNDPQTFKMSNIRGYDPMTAKELDTEEKQDNVLGDSNYYIEEKFDGTRGLVYFLSQADVEDNEVGFCRVFSRRISKKTGFYVENTDSLPQIREIDIPELNGTILDGELFINNKPFKEVASTLNCLWDKAIDRQLEKGFISFHAFDILFYKGIDLRKMPLNRRKEYLHLAVEEANSPYIEEVAYYECGKNISLSHLEYLYRIEGGDEDLFLEHLEENKDTYPNLYKCVESETNLTPRAYYELIVATGGEGVIIKPKDGRYLHKRGWEYSKIKKFLTRELIVIGFEEPTKEYTGKDVRKWGYWVEKDTDKRVQGNFYGDPNYIPVTKYYYYRQVGVMKLGVIISIADYEQLPKNKRSHIYEIDDIRELGDEQFQLENYIMEVCECSGFDDDTREYFTRNRDRIVGSVVEVKANELFKDSGKMRHPRYMRMRFDKEPEQCIWADHIGDNDLI